MINVPDTETFGLQDVVDAVNPTTDDLVDCFADAVLNLFNPTYYIDGSSLLEFRDYGDTSWYAFWNVDREYNLYDIQSDLEFSFDALYGNTLPDDLGVQSISGTFCDSTKTAFGTVVGHEPLADFDPSVNGVITRSRILNKSFAEEFDLHSISPKIGVFYYRVSITSDGDQIKLYEPSIDSVGTNYIYFKFTVVEHLTPSSIGYDSQKYLNEIVTAGMDGAFTVAVTSGGTWISLDTVSGSDNDPIQYDISSNSGPARTGNIRVTSSNGYVDFPIEQSEPI